MSVVRAQRDPLIDRSELSDLLPVNSLAGWVASSADLTSFVPVDRAGMAVMRDITAETLGSAGLRQRDRAVIALNMEGACVGANWAESVSQVALLSVAAPVHRPLRIADTIDAISADVLITNATTAWRMARAIRWTGRDPADLQLRLLVLTGEIVRRSDLNRLGTTFHANVVETWSDPLFGVALAVGEAGPDYSRFTVVRPGILDTTPVTAAPGSPVRFPVREWTFVPTWCDRLNGYAVRTGIAGPPSRRRALEQRWTIGNNLLVRGRWLDLQVLNQMACNAGFAIWSLEVTRGLNSDRATVLLPAINDTRSMAQQLASLPIRIDIRTLPPPAVPTRRVIDRRRQHLGPRKG